MKRALLLGCCLGATLLSQAAQAQVTNGSFESGFTGWTTSSGPLGTGGGEGFTDGANAAILNGGSGVGTGVISQSFATTPGQRYLLQFDYGNYQASTPQTMVAAVTGTGTLASLASQTNGSGAGGNTTWQRQNVLFTANSATTTIAFTDTTTGAPSSDGILDRVSVSSFGQTLNPGGAGTLGTINFVSGELSRGGAPNAVGLSPTATQNTTYPGALASRGIDGNSDGNWGANSTTHTDPGAVNDFWQVALGTLPGQPNAGNHSYAISRIDLFGRTDCCSERLMEFNVNVVANGATVSANPFDLGTPGNGNVGGVAKTGGSQNQDGSGADSGVSVRLPTNTVGDTVRIVQNAAFPLSLAEVQAFGLATYIQDAADALNIDISASGNDFVNVQQQAVLKGTLNTTLLGGYSPSPGTIFNVLSTPTGQLNIAGLKLTGDRFVAQVVNIGGRDVLQLVATPEPASIALWLLLGLTVSGMAYRQRRK